MSALLSSGVQHGGQCMPRTVPNSLIGIWYVRVAKRVVCLINQRSYRGEKEMFFKVRLYTLSIVEMGRRKR